MATADLNRDGKLDFIAADEFGFIVVFIGNGDGTFIETLRVQTGQQTNGVTVGDFNRDGKLDLAVANFGSDTISILLGNGDGTFQPKTDYLAGHFPGFVTTSDFNRDGALDLVVANSTSISNSGLPGSVSIFLGNGDGTFRPKVDYLSGADAPTDIAASDFNGDGILDLGIAHAGIFFTTWILLGNGDGTFAPSVLVGSGDFALAAADYNRDGKLDLAATFGAQLLLYPGLGNGTFAVPSDLSPVTGYLTGLTTGDFNRDGKVDLAALDQANGTVSVYLNAAPLANTQAGQNIVVNLVDSTTRTFATTITFSTVTQPGTTTLTVSSGGPASPSGFKLGNPSIYFGLTTTAVFSGPVTICINYSGISFGSESAIKFFHFDNNAWVDATTSLDTMNNIICATVASFSAFSIFEPAVIPVQIDIKPGGFPNSIKLSSQGNIPVAILSSSTLNAPANVDKTSLTFGRTGNEKSFAFCDSSIKDVNHDKLPDLVCYFITGLTGFQLTDTVGILKGKSVNGTLIQGSDSVRIVP